MTETECKHCAWVKEMLGGHPMYQCLDCGKVSLEKQRTVHVWLILGWVVVAFIIALSLTVLK